MEDASLKNTNLIDRDPNIVGFENSSSDSDEDMGAEGTSEIQEMEVEIKNNSQEILGDNHSNLEQSHSENPSIIKVEANLETNGLLNKVIKTEPFEKPKASPAIFIPIYRDPKVQKERLKLPITAEEQIIMEVGSYVISFYIKYYVYIIKNLENFWNRQ